MKSKKPAPITTSVGTKHVHNILNYLWKDEKRHYEESGQPKDHIFESLVVMATLTHFRPPKD